MPAYGYSKAVVNEYGLHELSEVSFEVPTGDLRRIAAFLIDCADRADSGEWRTSHLHISTFDREWKVDHPHPDVIVLHPSPDPPLRIR